MVEPKEFLKAAQLLHGHKCPAMPLGLRAGAVAMNALGVARAKEKEKELLAFASAAGFLGHASLAGLDARLTVSTALGAGAGALLGSYLMTEKLKGPQVKKLLGVVLVTVALRMAWGLLSGSGGQGAGSAAPTERPAASTISRQVP